jgi:hypothetical protein
MESPEIVSILRLLHTDQGLQNAVLIITLTATEDVILAEIGDDGWRID